MSKTSLKMVSAILIIAIALVVTPASVGWCSEKISRPLEYSGYTFVEWNDSVRASEYVTMTDGTKIAVDYYLPSEYIESGTPPTSFPVVLIYTPYSRGYIDPKTGIVTDAATAGNRFNLSNLSNNLEVHSGTRSSCQQ